MQTRTLAIRLLVMYQICVPPANAEEFKSGIYENVLLAVDKDGDITGQYQEVQGEGVRKSCSFYFKGKAKGGAAEIITWSDRQLPGRLKAVKGGIELKVPAGREHPGCGLVLLPQISEGISLDMCQSALKINPPSASKIDPPQVAVFSS